MANLNAALSQTFYAWPDNAVQALIRQRRAYQGLFATSALRDQGTYWARISSYIARNSNFAPTDRQCRTKWNALKKGYENLERLLDGNPEGYPTHTPTMHDERFHDELSDEFWLTERNYLFII